MTANLGVWTCQVHSEWFEQAAVLPTNKSIHKVNRIAAHMSSAVIGIKNADAQVYCIVHTQVFNM